VRWVEKVSEGGKEGRYTAYAVLDADARRLSIPLAGVSEHDAAAMVATGGWRYVYEVSRPVGTSQPWNSFQSGVPSLPAMYRS
jgi:hypothetical protein